MDNQILLQGGVAAIILWIVAEKIVAPLITKMKTPNRNGNHEDRLTAMDRILQRHDSKIETQEIRMSAAETDAAEMKTNFAWLKRWADKMDQKMEEIAKALKT